MLENAPRTSPATCGKRVCKLMETLPPAGWPVAQAACPPHCCWYVRQVESPLREFITRKEGRFQRVPNLEPPSHPRSGDESLRIFLPRASTFEKGKKVSGTFFLKSKAIFWTGGPGDETGQTILDSCLATPSGASWK